MVPRGGKKLASEVNELAQGAGADPAIADQWVTGWSPAPSDRMRWAKFWTRVDAPSDFQCWNWKGHKNDAGYGRFELRPAHRIAYEMLCEPIPEGMIIRHRCDNPACVNPRHLEPGTHKQNMEDCVTRGRIASGSRAGRRRLTDEQADYVRRNPDGLTLSQIATKFGIAVSTASYIRSGRSWKYLRPGATP